MLVLLVAVAVKVMVPAPWQRTEIAPCVKTGVPTVGVMVTVCIPVTGPLQPVALAVMIVEPVHPDTYVTSPVEALMVLPAVTAAAFKLYVMPVELVAVAL
jgi:hypothetical protein